MNAETYPIQYSQGFTRQVKDYILLKVIGKGTTATVYLSQHIPSQKLCAIKLIRISSGMERNPPAESFSKNEQSADLPDEISKDQNEEENKIQVIENNSNSMIINNIIREIKIMQAVDSIFVTKIYDYFFTTHHFAIVMEYCENGSLLDYVMNPQSPRLTEKQISTIIVETIAAISSLHQNNIIHRDIKLDNIFLDKYGHVRIGDFGMSRFIDQQQKCFNMTICGSPIYASPEMIMREKYDGKTDVWSIGIVAYVLLFYKFPFYSENIQDLYTQIIYGELSFPININYSPSAYDFVCQLLDKNPDKRPTIEECKTHPFIQGNIFYCLKRVNIPSICQVDHYTFYGIAYRTAKVINCPEDEIMDNYRKGIYNKLTVTYRLFRDEIISDQVNKVVGNISNNFEPLVPRFPKAIPKAISVQRKPEKKIDIIRSIRSFHKKSKCGMNPPI